MADFLNDIQEWKKFFVDTFSPLKSMLHTPSFPQPRTATKFSSDEQVKNAWDKIHALPAYVKLALNPNFKSAVASFEKIIKPGIVEEAWFLMSVTFYVYRFILETELPELVKQPDARTRKQAAATARKLRRLAKEGARLENIQDQAKLESFLVRLESQMDKRPVKRPRNDETRTERLFVKRLAADFIHWFGQPLATVLTSLAAVISYDPDSRNIEHIVTEAKKEHLLR